MRSAAQGGKKEGAREAVSFAVGEHRCELGEGLVTDVFYRIGGVEASRNCDKCRIFCVAMPLWRRAGKCVFFCVCRGC